jgi:hypothetical protein
MSPSSSEQGFLRFSPLLGGEKTRKIPGFLADFSVSRREVCNPLAYNGKSFGRAARFERDWSVQNAFLAGISLGAGEKLRPVKRRARDFVPARSNQLYRVFPSPRRLVGPGVPSAYRRTASHPATRNPRPAHPESCTAGCNSFQPVESAGLYQIHPF